MTKIKTYIGQQGCGKTLSITAYADNYRLKKRKNKIYCNYKLIGFKNFELLTHEKLELMYKEKRQFRNCLIIIDELHIFLDSRSFMKKGNKCVGYLLGQSHKRGVDMLGATHFPHLIDFRWRMYSNIWYEVKKGLIINNKWIPITTSGDNKRKLSKFENEHLYIALNGEEKILDGFSYRFKKLDMQLIKADKYFNMFDTRELIL